MLKKKDSGNNDFSAQVNNERVYRSISVNEALFKNIKIESILKSKSIYDIVNDNLTKIIQDEMLIDIESFAKDTEPEITKSFAINKKVLNEAKKYAVEHNYTLKEMLLAALQLH
jgi:hypothetical protein